MKCLIVSTLVITALIPPANAKKVWVAESGIAIDQKIIEARAGWGAMIVGRGVVAGPRFQHRTIITVETGPYRYDWEETKNKNPLVFVINEPFWFYRDRSWFLVVDPATRKTHKFALVGAMRK